STARQFLISHNFYRGRLRSGQETGRTAVPELQNLLWDTNLAKIASASTRKCIYKLSDSPGVRENVFWSTSPQDPVGIWHANREHTKEYD
ncbi:hypothetical protein X801_09242, partial [Opisthorchis viverrini]